MGSINGLYRKAKGLNIDPIIKASFEDNKDQLLETNRQQLLAGKNREGNDIAPSYLDDPYFKSRASAQRYSDWKDRITPNAKRRKGTPNLFIRGDFHESLNLNISKDALNFISTFHSADDIERKFKMIYGLGGEFKAEFVKDRLRPSFMSKVRNYLNL